MRALKRRKHWLPLLLLFSLLPLMLVSCGGDGGGGVTPPPPPPTILSNPSLLSVEKLKSWIDNGNVDDQGHPVVILDTSFGGAARTDYDAGHIPGAHYVDFATELVKTRSDGVIEAALQVADGPQFDAHIQKYGIDGNTTVVFTGHHIYWTTRAYWTYRYWGFPQSHLFVLNGKGTTVNSVWTAAGHTLETTEPALPAPSAFSVSSWPGNMDLVRASTEDFFDAMKGNVPNVVIVDTRGESEWNANPPATRAFEFRVRGSVWHEWTEDLVGADYTEKSTGSHVLRPIADIIADLNALGLTEDKTAYTF